MQIAIHIGQAKTGSTTTQRWLASNGPVLESLGWRYLETGRSRGPFHRPGVSMWGHGQIHAALFARKFGLPLRPAPRWVLTNEMLAEIDEFDGLGALLSMESLYHTQISKVGPFLEGFQRDGDVVRLVVYVRRQAEQLDSLYRQRVKASDWTGTFEDWLADPERSDYFARLAALEQSLRPEDSILARTFSRRAFVKGDLIEDFVSSVMGGEVPTDAVSVNASNLSLDTEAVALKVALNAYLDEKGAAAVGASLVRWCGGRDRPKSSLFTAQRYNAFQDQFREENEQLIGRWGLDQALIDDPPPRFADEPMSISAARARDIIDDLATSEPNAVGLIDKALPEDHPFRPVRRYVMGA